MHAPSRAGLLVTIGLFALIASARADPVPRGVVGLPPGAYLVGEIEELPEAIRQDGITIEMWFLPLEAPNEGEITILYSIPGVMELSLDGPDWGEAVPKGTAHAHLSYWTEGAGGGRWSVSIRPCRAGVENWFYFRLQASRGSVEPYWRGCEGSGRGQGKGSLAGGARIFVGGIRPRHVVGLPWGGKAMSHTTFKGWIDELKISRGFRDLQNPPMNRGPFSRDKSTLALWHFDESALATRYRDASGNGHDLLAGGTLAVDVSDKTATRWATLKAQTR
jgi:hypothetical protein